MLTFCPTLLWAASEGQETRKIVNLRDPYSSIKMQYAKELLSAAYNDIGFKINWMNVTSTQELELVNSSKLAGALARHPIIEQEFPSLVRVPFELLDFKLLKVSDRLRCGYCLDEDINSIIFAKGARISEQYAHLLRSTMDKLAINSSPKLNEMILKRRADSVLIMDFQLATEIAKDHHKIVETITHAYDYHYLSPNYGYLKQPLTNALLKLEQNGTVAKLQQKYKITVEKKLKEKPEKIRFVSGNWEDYTNADGSGIYWGIIDKLFDSDFEMTKSSSIWVRAIRAFETNKADVLVGAYRQDKIENALFSSFHIDYEYPLYVFARNDAVLTRFKAEDKSLTVCLDSGSSLLKYANFLQKENVIETTLTQCDLLIDKGKVDIVIEFDYNVNKHTLALPKIELIEASPIFLVFHNTAQGHFLKSYFDEHIEKLARDNVLKNVFPNNITYKQAHIRP